MNNISARDLLHLFLKNMLIIIVAAVICGVGSFVYCENFVDEKFASTGSILVTNGGLITEEDGEALSNGEIAASINLLPTIKKLLVTPAIFQDVAEKFNNKYSAGELIRSMHINSTEEHVLVLDITFELNSKEDVVKITDTFLNLVPDYIADLLGGARIVVTESASASYKTSPQTVKTTIIAFLIGAVLCYAIVFLISLFKGTIESDEEFSSRYDIPVIGNIPNFSLSNSKGSAKKRSQAGERNG